MIAGLEVQTDGDIYIGDECVNDISPKDRDVAFVFQSYALYPHLTVFENIAFPLKIRKIKKEEIKQKVLEVSEILGLSDLLNRKPKELSGGQRQRVALGRAIVRKPKVFLMDEPLSNLDAKLRVSMRSEIKKLHEKLQTTFVYVTHDQTEALTMGDKIVVLEGGNIQQQGSADEIFKNPENTFVATFMGNLPMNIIENDNEFIGFRPEDVIVGKQEEFNFIPKIDFCEILGADKIIHFDLNGAKCLAKINAEQNLDNLILSVSKDKIYHFDKETKKIIH